MNLLKSCEVFLAVAEARSFATAAGRLGLSRAAVSVQVAQFEAEVGAQLLSRHGRSVSLTKAGESIMEQAYELIDLADTMTGSFKAAAHGNAGQIRIGVPPVFAARIMGPVVAAFIALNPDVHISLMHDDGGDNLTRDGLDLSIRIVDGLDSTAETQLLLGQIPQRLVAAPAYLAARPPIRTPDDLLRHNCLTPDLGKPSFPWTFSSPHGARKVHVTGSVKANMAQVLRAIALLGKGIIMQPGFLLDSYIADGSLIRLLPGYEPAPLMVYALYGAQRSLLPRRVRALLDFIKGSQAFRDALVETGASSHGLR